MDRQHARTRAPLGLLLVFALLDFRERRWRSTVKVRSRSPEGAFQVILPSSSSSVAEGLIDPVNVAAPDDGTGPLFIVERVGTIRVVEEDGTSGRSPSSTCRAR